MSSLLSYTGVQCVLYLQWAIPDKALLLFYNYLYSDLKKGKYVSVAVNNALDKLRKHEELFIITYYIHSIYYIIYIILYYIILYYIILYHISYHIISYHIISYYIISYYIILYHIISYYIISYYIIL